MLIQKELGGARIGRSYFFAINATWPFIKMEVHRELVSLTMYPFFYKVSIEKQYIEKIQKVKFILFSGIKIVHKKQSAPRFIMFWTWAPKKLMESLKKAGYATEEVSFYSNPDVINCTY